LARSFPWITTLFPHEARRFEDNLSKDKILKQEVEHVLKNLRISKAISR